LVGNNNVLVDEVCLEDWGFREGNHKETGSIEMKELTVEMSRRQINGNARTGPESQQSNAQNLAGPSISEESHVSGSLGFTGPTVLTKAEGRHTPSGLSSPIVSDMSMVREC